MRGGARPYRVPQHRSYPSHGHGERPVLHGARPSQAIHGIPNPYPKPTRPPPRVGRLVVRPSSVAFSTTTASSPEATTDYPPQILTLKGTTAPNGPDRRTLPVPPAQESGFRPRLSAASVIQQPDRDGLDRLERRRDGLFADYRSLGTNNYCDSMFRRIAEVTAIPYCLIETEKFSGAELKKHRLHAAIAVPGTVTAPPASPPADKLSISPHARPQIGHPRADPSAATPQLHRVHMGSARTYVRSIPTPLNHHHVSHTEVGRPGSVNSERRDRVPEHPSARYLSRGSRLRFRATVPSRD